MQAAVEILVEDKLLINEFPMQRFCWLSWLHSLVPDREGLRAGGGTAIVSLPD